MLHHTSNKYSTTTCENPAPSVEDLVELLQSAVIPQLPTGEGDVSCSCDAGFRFTFRTLDCVARGLQLVPCDVVCTPVEALGPRNQIFWRVDVL